MLRDGQRPLAGSSREIVGSKDTTTALGTRWLVFRRRPSSRDSSSDDRGRQRITSRRLVQAQIVLVRVQLQRRYRFDPLHLPLRDHLLAWALLREDRWASARSLRKTILAVPGSWTIESETERCRKRLRLWLGLSYERMLCRRNTL